MQYKMQFTVLDDAVKQNRKLPEIAFFDTDGNLIHLGAGGGGGDVDVSALLPLDGSRAMTDMLGFSDGTADPDVFLERQYSGELVLAGVSLVDQYSYGERPDAFYGGQAEFLIATDHGDGAWNGPTIDMWVGYYSYGNGPIANMVIDGINRQIDMAGGKVHVHRKTAYHQAINHAFAVFDEGSGSGAYNPTWSVGDDGVMYWGDGTLVAPDVTLERTAPGTLEIDHILSFKGDAGDNTSGVTMQWNQDDYGLVLTGKVGSGGASMYFEDVEDSTRYSGIFPGAAMVANGSNKVMLNAVDHALLFLGDGDFTRLRWISHGVLELAPPEGPGRSAFRLHSPNGSLFDVGVANDGTLSAVPV